MFDDFHIICNKCEARSPANFRICGKCGSRLQKVQIDHKIGAVISKKQQGSR